MFKKLTLEFWYQALFFAICVWLLIVTNGCATTDQYGCKLRQSRQASKHYYIANKKCPGRVDLLYRADNPIRDSITKETVYLEGKTVYNVDTVLHSDTLVLNGVYFVRKLITRTVNIQRTDTVLRSQNNLRMVTVTQDRVVHDYRGWVFAVVFGLLFLWRLFRR